jgi:hypothetical protein
MGVARSERSRGQRDSRKLDFELARNILSRGAGRFISVRRATWLCCTPTCVGKQQVGRGKTPLVSFCRAGDAGFESMFSFGISPSVVFCKGIQESWKVHRTVAEDLVSASPGNCSSFSATLDFRSLSLHRCEAIPGFPTSLTAVPSMAIPTVDSQILGD